MTVIRRDPAKISARVAADLAVTKAQCLAKINDAAGVARQKFITTKSGQEMVYLAKEREAIAYLAAPIPLPTDYRAPRKIAPDLTAV